VSPKERFEALYAAHAPSVRAYAMRRGASADADDVVAEVFLIAWRRLGEVPADARCWLLAVARRVQSNAYRGLARQQALRARLEHERPLDAAPASAGERHLLDALLRLEESDREALLLIAWEGLSHRQAARVLGVREGTFGVRLHRAKRRLVRALTDAEAAPLEITTPLEVQ
jgi:RNA polymerase sigma-70 factor (ECF subfamily)